MDALITSQIINIVGNLVFKLAVLVVGYLLAKLGHDLLIKGVTGEFKFKSDIQGMKADLVSASPGLFFVLLGSLLIIVAIFSTKTQTIDITTERTPVAMNNKAATSLEEKPQLPSLEELEEIKR